MNSFGAQSKLRVGDAEYDIYRIGSLDRQGLPTTNLPYAMRVLLENLLRTEDGRSVRPEDVEYLAQWNPTATPVKEIAFTPARVLLQDFTGVPAVVDLASMRDAMSALGGDPTRINPLQPVELVIDHSVQVDEFGRVDAMQLNGVLDYQRNQERYAFLRWGQNAFNNFAVVPPEMGIVHQINLEYLARVVFVNDAKGKRTAYPDTLVGTDSHTTMINGLGVLGWGVGGIEAEAAMLGQPVTMLLPQVVGFELRGRLAEGATATDLVLTVTEMLRKLGVVGKFVEFYGDGLAELQLADRATIANMAPEYGATCGIFPVDETTLRYLRMTGRKPEQIALVEAYCKEQGLWGSAGRTAKSYSETIALDLSKVEPSVSGPKRPQDRVRLSQAADSFRQALPSLIGPKGSKTPIEKVTGSANGSSAASQVGHGSVVIAAITSCTNTSNPSVMLAAGLLAKKAVERGLQVPAWVKTSLAPGSRVVTAYYKRTGLLEYLEKLKFHVVGYGCTTCIGNSGPLPPEISQAVQENELVVASVLSGNRNFEGRINSDVRANYLMSPPLVVAYALAGRIDRDLTTEPLGTGSDGRPVFLREIWPTQSEVQKVLDSAVSPEMFEQNYANVYAGDERWQKLPTPSGQTFAWGDDSTYVKRAPYFDGMELEPKAIAEIRGARVLAFLSHSVTTDHISPAGSIKVQSPAGKYLQEHGVKPVDFNSYGSRRGNHEVMVRGTFANVRLRNRLVEVEGGWTRHLPSGEEMFIFDASERYRAEGVPLIVLAGKEYGSGSSRDWAAKGPLLLGVRAVIAESFERIHRSNLVGMGILPLQFQAGEDADTHRLTGEESFDIIGLAELLAANLSGGRLVTVAATDANGRKTEFQAIVRIDTPQEIHYYRHGGILQFVLRQLLGRGAAA